MKKLIIGVSAIALLLSVNFAVAESDSIGQPFQDLWDEVVSIWESINEIELTPGPVGESGEDGLNCWDMNGNGVEDSEEDVNADGSWDVFDCKGPQGEPGESWDESSFLALEERVAVLEALYSPAITIGANLDAYEMPSAEECNILVPVQYATIQAGIDAAVDGDTVCVGAGTYNENVDIRKTIKLSGSGAANTSINAQSRHTAMYIAGDGNADNVTVEGFLITGFDGAGYNDPTPFNIGPGTTGTTVRYNRIEAGNEELAVRADSNQTDMLIYNNILVGQNSGQIFMLSGVQGSSYNADFINNTFIGTVADTGSIMSTWATDGLIQGNIFDATGLINFLIAGYPSNIVNENNLKSDAQLAKVRAYSGVTMNAENNWWGDLDPSDDIWGDIDYTPFETSPFAQF